MKRTRFEFLGHLVFVLCSYANQFLFFKRYHLHQSCYRNANHVRKRQNSCSNSCQEKRIDGKWRKQRYPNIERETRCIEIFLMTRIRCTRFGRAPETCSKISLKWIDNCFSDVNQTLKNRYALVCCGFLFRFLFHCQTTEISFTWTQQMLTIQNIPNYTTKKRRNNSEVRFNASYVGNENNWEGNECEWRRRSRRIRRNWSVAVGQIAAYRFIYSTLRNRQESHTHQHIEACENNLFSVWFFCRTHQSHTNVHRSVFYIHRICVSIVVVAELISKASYGM